MHDASFQSMRRFKDLFLADETKPLKIVDVGSCDVNGCYRPIFSVPGWSYTGIDILPGNNVDVVLSDPYKWPIQSNSVDIVISGQAFEHTEYIWMTMQEIARILKAQGLCCIIAPSTGPVHKYPIDCWRIQPDGMVALAKSAGLETVVCQTKWECQHVGKDKEWNDVVLIARKPMGSLDMNIAGFYHVAMMGSWERVVPEQIKRMKRSGILDLGPLTIGVVGPEDQLSKCNVVLKDYPFTYLGPLNLYEYPTLEILYRWCRNNAGSVWYVHTKGVSKFQGPQDVPTTDWRRLMEHFVIDEHQKCREILKDHDTCGALFNGKPPRYYAGNFWWARSEHIKALPSPMSLDRHDRFSSETWIGLGPGTMYSLFDSDLWLYTDLCPEWQYESKKEGRMGIHLGDRSYTCSYYNPGDGHVHVGNYTSIAAGVMFLGNMNHYSVKNRNCVTSSPFADPKFWHDANDDIYIGSDVWIGTNVMLLPGVTIGHGAIVGAGCVVSKDVAPYSVVVGNPQRTIKYRFDQNTISKLMKIEWWSWLPETVKEREKEFQDVYTFINKFCPEFASPAPCDILDAEEDEQMKHAILLAIFCGALLAGESDPYVQALIDLRRAQTDHAALVPAIRALTKVAADFEQSGDQRAAEVNSCLYWAKKRMTLADTNALKSDVAATQKIEAIAKPVPAEQAKSMLDAAEAFAGKSQDSLLVAVRFFEVADRFPDAPEGRKAMAKSLEMMAKVGTEKLAVYHSVSTDGRAFVQSEPSGASILLLTSEGRKDTGKRTPSLIELPKGEQHIELTLKGFKDNKITMTINGTIAKTEKIVMDPLTVPVDVIFESGWHVFVDGKPDRVSQETPCTTEIPLGKHDVSLAKDGFVDLSSKPIEVTIDGIKGAPKAFTLELKEKVVVGQSVLMHRFDSCGNWTTKYGKWTIKHIAGKFVLQEDAYADRISEDSVVIDSNTIIFRWRVGADGRENMVFQKDGQSFVFRAYIEPKGGFKPAIPTTKLICSFPAVRVK